MRITLPDDVLDAYQTFADRQGIPLDQVVAAQLRRFAKLEPGKKAVVVPAALDEPLATRLGGLPLKDGADLVGRLSQLAGITFGDVRIDLTPAQAAEIDHRASRQGRHPEALVREMAAVIVDQLFWATGGGAAGEGAGTRPPPTDQDASSPLDALAR